MYRKLLAVWMILGLTAAVLAGCRIQPPISSEDPVTPGDPGEFEGPEAVAVLDPTEIAALEFPGRWTSSDKGHCVSPNEGWILVATHGKQEETMSAVPLLENAAEQPIVFYSVDTSWTKNNLVQWVPIGWLTDEKCVFLVHGWQNQGQHEDERGTAVMVGELSARTPSLLAFIESPRQGSLVDETIITPDGELLLRVSSEIWMIDLESGASRLLTDTFPDYGPLFYLAVSPTGEHVVYTLNDDDRRGTFIMDLKTGDERPLLLSGEIFSFYPSWSPDGKYIMAYSAKPLPDASGSGLQLYATIPGEDGPRAAAEMITIVDVQGNVVKEVTLDQSERGAGGDKDGAATGEAGDGVGGEASADEPLDSSRTRLFLFQSAWLSDSQGITFISASVVLGKWGEPLSIEYRQIWTSGVDADSAAVAWADVRQIEEANGERIGWIYPVAVLPGGAGVLVSTVGESQSSIWRVTADGPADKLMDGWWQTARLQPYYLDSVVGIAGVSGAGSQVLAVSPSKTVVLGEADQNHWLEILGHSHNLLVWTDYDPSSGDSVIHVHSMHSLV